MRFVPTLAAAACLASCVHETDTRPVYHLVRSNSDGSEAEQIVVFARSPKAVDVAKMRDACTSAAYVTARLDPKTGQAQSLVGGRLQRDGKQLPQAWLRYENGNLVARLETPDAAPAFTLPVGARWVLYDFDFSDLIAHPPAEIIQQKEFAVDLPLILVGDNGPKAVNLGRLSFRNFAVVGKSDGTSMLLYTATGPALGSESGTFAFDAQNGALLKAKMPVANHAEYKDFELNLVKTERGEAAWKRRLAQHWAGCPKKGD